MTIDRGRHGEKTRTTEYCWSVEWYYYYYNCSFVAVSPL